MVLMNEVIASLWGKTKSDEGIWHPLILHMLDVAASAEVILAREPESTRTRMAQLLGLDWNEARPWLLLLIACHDLGKASPGFQCKNMILSTPLAGLGLKLPRIPNTKINHAFVSQIALTTLLQEQGWPIELSELASDAVGCHHGERAKPSGLDKISGDISAIGGDDWAQARRSILTALMQVLGPSSVPQKETISGPDFMLLSGLTSFSDWIGSNENWFPFGKLEDCEDLQGWFNKRKISAQRALDGIGWEARASLAREPQSFKQIFTFDPRPLQKAVSDSLSDVKGPSVLLIEAPMGEGKTEAAFFAHLELQRRFEHRGLYIALPTKATGNAMFNRTLDFLRGQGCGRKLDIQLLHGATLLNETFQKLKFSGIYDASTDGEIRAGEWFTHKKRALLSEYGVGTVDQALLPILPVRHNFVRLWGLANRVVVFDEVHAYDTYTGTLLAHLLRWLLALGSSVVLLSATLAPSFRRKLGELTMAKLPEKEVAYPRLSIFRPGASVLQKNFEADPARRIRIKLLKIQPDLASMYSLLNEYLNEGGMGLAIINTVQRAQDLYRLFPDGERLEYDGQYVGKRLADGTEVYLFHARFPADRRQKREENAVQIFGHDAEKRSGRKILIATQVVEQSLDLDFDIIATDLAPIDLLLQRAGRLWRHSRGPRPISEPVLAVAGLDGDEPPSFSKPLWWGAVYREDVLLRTWSLLHAEQRQSLSIPEEIDSLVKAVYEEEVHVPEFLQERLAKALEAADGNAFALKGQADQAIIGLPDDASWNQPERFVLYDEDEPFVHRSLMAHTRIGDDSILAIPFFPDDKVRLEEVPDLETSKKWFMRAVSLSRMGVVRKLKALGVPEGWKKNPLLRNCFPLVLDAEGRWVLNAKVLLNDELGIVYESEEAE